MRGNSLRPKEVAGEKRVKRFSLAGPRLERGSPRFLNGTPKSPALLNCSERRCPPADGSSAPCLWVPGMRHHHHDMTRAARADVGTLHSDDVIVYNPEIGDKRMTLLAVQKNHLGISD